MSNTLRFYSIIYAQRAIPYVELAHYITNSITRGIGEGNYLDMIFVRRHYQVTA